MDVASVLLIVLLIAACALCATAIWALVDLVATSRSMRALSDESRQRLVPLLDKVDVTVDAVNAELLRIDLIVSRFEIVSERMVQTSETVSGIANAPERIVEDITARVRGWSRRRHERAAESRADRERPEGPTTDSTATKVATDATTEDR